MLASYFSTSGCRCRHEDGQLAVGFERSVNKQHSHYSKSVLKDAFVILLVGVGRACIVFLNV